MAAGPGSLGERSAVPIPRPVSGQLGGVRKLVTSPQTILVWTTCTSFFNAIWLYTFSASTWFIWYTSELYPSIAYTYSNKLPFSKKNLIFIGQMCREHFSLKISYLNSSAFKLFAHSFAPLKKTRTVFFQDLWSRWCSDKSWRGKNDNFNIKKPE